MSDIYQPYRDLCAGKDVPIYENRPYPGRYRMKRGNGFVAVLINADANGAIKARVGKNIVDATDVWIACAKHPVDKAAFDAFEATGAWPGDAPEVGHNSGALSLAEQIRDYAAQALGWLKTSGISDVTSKDMAANYRAKLIELRKSADAEREAKKRPHDEAAKAVQAQYKPLIDEADSAANELRDALTVYMREEERKEREAREKAYREEQARVEAERRRLEAERAAKMAKDPIAALTEPEPELPMAPAAPEPVKVRAGGQGGRAAGLRTVTIYEVTDYAAALSHCKDHPDVVAVVEKVAKAQAKAGATVPGVEKRTEKVAA